MLLVTGVFGVVVLFKHPVQEHFIFGISQQDPVVYFDVRKLTHVLLYVINRPISQSLTHHASVFTVHGPVFDNLSTGLFSKKNNLHFMRTQNVSPFLFRPVDVFFGRLVSNQCLLADRFFCHGPHAEPQTFFDHSGAHHQPSLLVGFFNPFECCSFFFHICLVLLSILKRWRSS